MKWSLPAISILLLAAVSPADAQRARSRPTAPRAALRPSAKQTHVDPDFKAAFKETLFCGGTSKQPAPENCDSTWRGIHWYIKNGSIGEINPPIGTSWLFECTYDAVEGEERCAFRTGDAFAIIFVGGQTLLTWGYRRFPGSDLVARFDDDGALRTTDEDGWTWTQSEAIMRKMMYKKVLRYRWSDWPNNSSHDGDINLDRFADVAPLMKAISYTFSSIQADRRAAARN